MAGLLVARVGLGVFEAGFGPGIPLYFCKADFCFFEFVFTSPMDTLALFYLKEEIGLRLAYWFGGLHPPFLFSSIIYQPWITGAALAGSFGGLSK